MLKHPIKQKKEHPQNQYTASQNTHKTNILLYVLQDQKSGKTALMMAVETKDIRIVNLLLEQVDADTARQLVNMQNRAGNSALHLAAGLRDVAVEVKEQILRKLIMSGGE